MRYTKLTLITAFALFSLFFGAGNIILPPYLGFTSGDQWLPVTLGFAISAVFIPILGIRAHARLQGSLLDFADRMSPVFSVIFGVLVYLIAVALPAPRTASLTHEMAIAPYFDTSSLLTSSIYFLGVFIFVIFRSRILDITGKVLTPVLLVLLSAIILLILTGPSLSPLTYSPEQWITKGLLEGYQTFDAMGAVVVGAVIIISLNYRKELDYHVRRKVINRAGILAGSGLCIIYTGLIYGGALLSNTLDPDLDRSGVLNAMITYALGEKGHIFLAILIALACFSTTVGIITGASDFVKGLLPKHKWAYLLTALLSCITGVLIGQLKFEYIIEIALPVLLFIYPLIIIFILLHNLPQKWVSAFTFRAVTLTVILFSIPDIMNALGYSGLSEYLSSITPWNTTHFSWILPAAVVFILAQSKKEPEGR